MRTIGRLFSWAVPRTLFGRAFLSVFSLSLVLVTLTGGWFHHRIFRQLDAEASQHLLNGARLLAADLAAWRPLPEAAESERAGTTVVVPDPAALDRFLTRRFGAGNALGWIQNVYWVDFRDGRARFLASYSAEAATWATLLPPTIDEVEDLVYEAINILDAGQPAFPDPFAQTSERRFKTVLWPILDGEGFLESVIGLEADLDYLDLSVAARQTTAWAALLAVPLCLLISYGWARGSSRRIDRLLADLDRLERREEVSGEALGIRELDTLRCGLAHLGRQIEARDRHLQEVHAAKVQELSLLGGAIAHEVRNPLAAIELHLGLLRRRAAPGMGNDESWQEIQQQLADLKALIERFLVYTRRVEPRCEPFAIASLATAALERAAQVPPPFVWRWMTPDPLAAGLVKADAAMVAQVLDNLIANARAARSEGLVLELALDRTDGQVRLTISDNGPGVPPALADRLFTPFVSGRPDGHGIGLALSRKLVEANQGRLNWRPVPVPGQGACFCIELPPPDPTLRRGDS